MPVATWTQPDFETQVGPAYKGPIDNCFAVAERIARAFAPHEASPADMTVVVDAGWIFAGGTLIEVAQQTSAAFVAPATHPRIDRIVYDAATGTIEIVAGVEDPDPDPPAIPNGKAPVCQVPLETDTTAITNQMIVDERVSAGSGGGGWEVGDLKATARATPTAGWLMYNGDSIGSAASAADQASDDYEELFKVLWDAKGDAEAPVSGGRGASAQADWDADKTLTMPDAQGRAIIGSGTGAGLTARTHGAMGGSEDLAQHNHNIVTRRVGTPSGTNNTLEVLTVTGNDAPGTLDSHDTDDAGTGNAGNMPPWVAENWMIRYQ